MMKIKTQNKLILLNAIRERKSVLFGNFKSTSNDEKVESWKSVHNIAQSLQLATSDRSWQFTRDKLYGLWKCRTLEKRDNKKGKFTGKAGGKKCQYDDVDLAILDILDEDSAIVQGLGLPGSSTFAETLLDFSNKKTKADNENDRAELIKIEIYIRKLQALKLERELGLQPSIFTKDLVKESLIQEVELVNVPVLDLDASNTSIDLFGEFYFSVFACAFNNAYAVCVSYYG
ncbi:uncharacterized protein LOC126551836 isoform X3 [Aphis gossypii]|uniref:uncharacterized protein LOC126550286 isoform X3 n=1 Tax=Aphis gossypii TaxID=80765 RepID=UPI002159A0A3|nr:uncharacterized protein LOC126550286 isoform X3 [Aphis gossypii]XP_050062087.1 uncharacterized protein LOC126551836 isoform X3 [Aphis gossypii]